LRIDGKDSPQSSRRITKGDWIAKDTKKHEGTRKKEDAPQSSRRITKEDWIAKDTKKHEGTRKKKMHHKVHEGSQRKYKDGGLRSEEKKFGVIESEQRNTKVHWLYTEQRNTKVHCIYNLA
jgi:hypothetical protein